MDPFHAVVPRSCCREVFRESPRAIHQKKGLTLEEITEPGEHRGDRVGRLDHIATEEVPAGEEGAGPLQAAIIKPDGVVAHALKFLGDPAVTQVELLQTGAECLRDASQAVRVLNG